DWIWTQNQEGGFHKKRARKLLVGEPESCPFQRWQWRLTHPSALRWRCRKRVRRYLMRSAEMNFSDLRKHLRPMLFDDRGCDAFDFTCDAAPKPHPQLLSLSLQPIDKRFTRQNRCCRDRDV